MRRIIIIIIITCTCNGSPWFSWYTAKVWHAAAFSCNGFARGTCADAYIYLVIYTINSFRLGYNFACAVIIIAVLSPRTQVAALVLM